MNLSLLKYFSYIIVLLSTCLAYPSNQCKTLFYEKSFEEELQNLHEYLEDDMKEAVTNQFETEYEAFKEYEDRNTIINTFIDLKSVSEQSQKEKDPLWIRSLYMYTDLIHFRVWIHKLQIFYRLKNKMSLDELNSQKSNGLSLRESIEKRTTGTPLWTNLLKMYDQDISFREWMNEFQNFILQLPNREKNNEVQDMIIKTASKQQKLNEALSKDVDKNLLLDTFTTSQPSKNALQTEFLKIYMYDFSFREWFHELQRFQLTKNNPQITREELDRSRQSLKESMKPAWKKFSEAYNKDTSFPQLVDQFQNFILQSLDIKKEIKSSDLIKNYENNILQILRNQVLIEKSVLVTNPDSIASNFINTQNITNPSWAMFVHHYATLPPFREWFHQLQIIEAVKNNPEVLFQIPKTTLSSFQKSVPKTAQMIQKWGTSFELYTDKENSSFKAMTMEFQKFISQLHRAPKEVTSLDHVQDYENNILPILRSQFLKEKKILIQGKEDIAVKFLDEQNIKNQYWAMIFTKKYASLPAFREWFHQLQMIEAARNGSNISDQLDEDTFSTFRKHVAEMAQKSETWSKILTMYVDEDPSFKIMTMEFQRFIFNYE